MEREVVGSRSKVIAVVFVFLALALSSVLYGCSGSSEVIVGKWVSSSIWSEEDGVEDFSTSANLTVNSNGSISFERASDQSKVSGNWETVPKSDWPPSGELNIVGYYKMDIRFDDQPSTFAGIVIRRDNGGDALMMLGNGWGYTLL